MSSPDLAAVAIDCTLLLPGVAGIWKAASLQGDLFAKWKDRVDLAYSGLSEQATAELLDIQRISVELIAGAGIPFDPLQVVKDPSQLRAPMQRFQHLLDVRDKVRHHFRRLLRVGPSLLYIFPVYMLGVGGIAAYHAKILKDKGLVRIVVALGGIGIALLIIVLVVYAYLQQCLSTAEILSQPESSLGESR